MSDVLREQLALLPEYLGRHLLLSVTALAVGIALSLPLSVLVIRVRWLRGPVLAVASTIQTIPSLALLALMVPLLNQIGFLPAVIALTLYSMLPIIRNTVTGIEGVDPNLTEAGRGLGMTPAQLLFRVQAPLAMPVIIAGIRTATVWVVGIATLSTPVGATSLGNYIFSGLQTQNPTKVLVGCVAAAALALSLDMLIRLMEVASTRRSKTLGIVAALGVVIVMFGGLAPLAFSRGNSDNRPAVVIGAKTFTEQYVLTALIADELEAAGFHTRKLESLGSTVVFDALATGQIDCYVDYTGTIWANHMKRTDIATAEDMLREVTQWLETEHGIVCLGGLGFENAYALAMPRKQAEQLGIKTIGDLFRHTPNMKIGGDYEFFSRPEWQRVVDIYDLQFAKTITMDSTLMYSAAANGDADVISAFSTDGRIAANDLLVLDDPQSALPPYDAVILLGAEAGNNTQLRAALMPLVGSVDAEAMRRANMRVDVDGGSIESAASLLKSAVDGRSTNDP